MLKYPYWTWRETSPSVNRDNRGQTFQNNQLNYNCLIMPDIEQITFNNFEHFIEPTSKNYFHDDFCPHLELCWAFEICDREKSTFYCILIVDWASTLAWFSGRVTKYNSHAIIIRNLIKIKWPKYNTDNNF